MRRAAGAEGPRYLIDGDGGNLPLEPVRRLVDSVESNGALVVVRTKASAASTVARALDEARLPEVHGDDRRRRHDLRRPAPPGRGNAARPPPAR